MGSNLEIFDPVTIAEWDGICANMGMDTIIHRRHPGLGHGGHGKGPHQDEA